MVLTTIIDELGKPVIVENKPVLFVGKQIYRNKSTRWLSVLLAQEGPIMSFIGLLCGNFLDLSWINSILTPIVFAKVQIQVNKVKN